MTNRHWSRKTGHYLPSVCTTDRIKRDLYVHAVASTDAAKHGPVRAEVKSTAVLNRTLSLTLGWHIDCW